jgi:hypothetical protein
MALAHDLQLKRARPNPGDVNLNVPGEKAFEVLQYT